MDHHHTNQGRTAVPLTRSEHKLISRQTYRQLLASKLGNAMSLFGIVSEISGLMTGNPDATINQFVPHADLGVVYKNESSSNYYTLTSLNRNGNYYTLTFDIFNGYGYDDKQKKYVGMNKIATGTRYEEREDFSETRVFDNDGNVKSVETHRSRKISTEAL